MTWKLMTGTRILLVVRFFNSPSPLLLHWNSSSQTSASDRVTQGLLKHRLLFPPQSLWFSLRWGPQISISKKFEGDAGDFSPAIKLTETSQLSLSIGSLPHPFQGSRVFSLPTSCPCLSSRISLWAFPWPVSAKHQQHEAVFWVKHFRCFASSLPMFLIFSFLPIFPVLFYNISTLISEIARWIGNMNCFSPLFFFIPVKC